MNSSFTRDSYLGFEASTLSIAVSLLAMAVVIGLGVIAWRRSGFRRAVLGLELLRIAIVALAVFLLNQPEFVEQFTPSERPTVAVLVDQSRSMETLDVGLDSSAQSLQTRKQAVEPLLKLETWQALEEKFDVVLAPFSVDDKESESDLHAAISAARDSNGSLRAVVMASDGDWNAGLPPVQAALRLRLEQIPILSIPVGSQTKLPDLDLISFDVPVFGIARKAVRIPFTIESSLPRDHVAQVELLVNNSTVLQHQVTISAMGRTSDAIVWEPELTGDFNLELRLPVQADERVGDNNSREAPIAIREEKLRVLVVESVPRWEYRFLRNALSRDPGVEVNCLLFHPGLSKVGGGNRDYIQEFPSRLEELSQFDVVFIGDVGVGEGQLTEEQCRLLKGLVEQQASGLVFIPGSKGNQLSLASTELDALLPVTLDNTQPLGWASQTPNHFALTELGRRSLLTKLADTQDENMQVWETLPGFHWYAPVIRAKAGADVLAVHLDVANEYGRVPLLVTKTFGAGKVLFMGTDGAWRWRRGVEDLYHYRFWGQVVRWMAYQRNMAKGESIRFYYSPEQPTVGQAISMTANVMEKNGEPLSRGRVTARVVAPSGRTESIQLSNTDTEWGAFAATMQAAEPGPHELVLRCEETGAELETTIFVQGATREQVGKPSRPEVLEELSRVTNGEVLGVHEIATVVERLAELPEPLPQIRRVQLWSHPLMAACMILLLGAFWVFRKVCGLI